MVSIKKNEYHFNLAHASKNEEQLISSVLKQALEEDHLVIEKKSQALLEDFRRIDSSVHYKSIVDYFRGKIPPSDLEILRASIYIKEVFDRGDSVRDLKFDLRSKYGQRGNNISNLYSTGYFDSLIKPMYEEMKKAPDFSSDKFLQRFDIIVTQYTFAVFVSAIRTQEDIKNEILNKIEINKKYGIHKLNIHGIGGTNVEKIRNILFEIKDDLSSIPDLNSESFYINATITF